MEIKRGLYDRFNTNLEKQVGQYTEHVILYSPIKSWSSIKKAFNETVFVSNELETLKSFKALLVSQEEYVVGGFKNIFEVNRISYSALFVSYYLEFPMSGLVSFCI